MLQTHNKSSIKHAISKKSGIKKMLEQEFTISEAFVQSSKEISEKIKAGKMQTCTEAEMNKMMDEWAK